MAEFVVEIETRVKEQYTVEAETAEEALGNWENGTHSFSDCLEILTSPVVVEEP